MVRKGGDFDYEKGGGGYALQRRPDPRFGAMILEALGPGRSVLNVGAGAGSYEPRDRHVVALEPSAAMRAQRPPELAPAVHGVAEAIPLDDRSVDASMATFTVHQWPDLEAGLREMRRVTRGPIVILTCDPDALDRFWLAAYAPEMIAVEARRYPAIARIRAALGGQVEEKTVPVPIDCTDGFSEAFYARPERLLAPEVRRAQSAWGFVAPEAQRRFVDKLGDDLESGEWDARYGAHRTLPTFEGSLRLIVAR